MYAPSGWTLVSTSSPLAFQPNPDTQPRQKSCLSSLVRCSIVTCWFIILGSTRFIIRRRSVKHARCCQRATERLPFLRQWPLFEVINQWALRFLATFSSGVQSSLENPEYSGINSQAIASYAAEYYITELFPDDEARGTIIQAQMRPRY